MDPRFVCILHRNEYNWIFSLIGFYLLFYLDDYGSPHSQSRHRGPGGLDTFICITYSVVQYGYYVCTYVHSQHSQHSQP